MIGETLAIAMVLVALAESPSPSSSATPAPVASTAPALSDRDLVSLITSIFRIDQLRPRVGLERLVKPANEMPPNDPMVHYAGRGPKGEAYLWIYANARTHLDPASLKAYEEAYTAALLAVAMERGAAGPDWQRRYEAATDKVAFTHGFAHAWTVLGERKSAKARSDIAWVHANIEPGMTRATVYALLKRRGLVATNGVYNPGRRTGPGSCEYESTASAAEWPRAGQPLPHTPCAPPGATGVLAHPAVFIDYTVGMNIACGTSVTQTFTFGAGDKLVSVTDSKESTTCL